ncbi:MAG TPA: sterol desaturase family protein [Chryseolinea sp.]|nr:sterol desaturase family protein [Chryseolinea sp.]
MLTFNITATILITIAFAIEVVLILLQKPDTDVVKDLKSNSVLGLLILLTGLFMKGVEFSVFSFMYSMSIFKPDVSWWLWIVGILSCDFIHWFYHWLGHKTQLFWAAHATHHSSEHFNMSTGWRTNFLHLFYRFLFWSPLCFLGLPPWMVLFLESVTAMQNFLVHTERVGKLGVLDWWLNTPSNHRVHHGVNPEYIDKNLGGIFMIYDHLFGTYAKEVAAPVYGLTHPIHTHSPVRIILNEFVNIGKEFPKRKGLVAKLRYLFSYPTT